MQLDGTVTLGYRPGDAAEDQHDSVQAQILAELKRDGEEHQTFADHVEKHGEAAKRGAERKTIVAASRGEGAASEGRSRRRRGARRGSSPARGRGRRRRGCHVDSPGTRLAATPRGSTRAFSR